MTRETRVYELVEASHEEVFDPGQLPSPMGIAAVASAACGADLRADENVIKVGILHSLSGTMAISEAVLKDTVLMLIETRTGKAACSGAN